MPPQQDPVQIRLAHWTFEANGKRSLNGKLYGVKYHGTALLRPGGEGVMKCLKAVVDHISNENKEMEVVDSVRVTVALQDPQ